MIAVLLHVVIALATLILSTLAWVKPATRKLHGTYILLALTLASGTYLAFMNEARILQTCLTGLVFVGAVTCNILLARHQLAKAYTLTD